MELIDSHCHLDDYIKENNLDDILDRSYKAGVKRMIAIGTQLEDWAIYHKLATQHPGQIYYTVGIHPCYVKDGWEDDLQALMPYFAEDTAPVALGEIGLDYFHLPEDEKEAQENIKQQKLAFAKQLSFALQLDCPVVIHSRKAFDDCVQMIDESGVDWKKIVFHCFVEGPEQVKILNARGARASFTGIITYKKADEVRQALIAQGLDMLMIETDAPYLSPAPHRGKINYPEYTVHIAEKCAELLELPYNEVCKSLTENTIKFFNL